MKKTFPYASNSLLSCAFIGALSLVLGGSLSQIQAKHNDDKPFPDVKLDKRAKGKAIPGKLGGKLAAVAEQYEKSEEELTTLCEQDQDINVDVKGRLFYSCEALPVVPPPLGGAVAAGPFPYGQTFLLHSRPGASKVIYLDFTGHTTTGTLWNSGWTGGAPIVTPPYDSDGNTSSFSNIEQDTIQRIWQRVSEDYAPYEVDVTTEDPGLENLRKTTVDDTNYGVRVAIGGSSNDWYGIPAGGVAYLDSFDWETDTPVFVFPAQLGNGFEKYVAEAASHETGHSFGLSHDGDTNGTEYYAGNADWAPIMGLGYYSNVTQFSKGDYTLANNQEDDLAMIASYVPYRLDQHSDTILNATPLPAGTNPTAGGVIETQSDADLFSFTTPAGPIAFSANPAAPEANLNIRLGLYNGEGNLIASADPAGLASTLNTTVAAGTYYLSVEGVGTGSPATAYDDYASIGQFSIAGTLPTITTNQPPVAVASNSAPLSGAAPLIVNFSSAGSSDPDGTIVSYSWDFGDGGTSTAANPQHSYPTAGTYVASLVVYDNGGLSASANVTITATPPGLPVPWLSANIGTTGVSGASTYNNGVYTVTGGGVGFLNKGTTDNFRYVYQTLTGDGSITVKLNTLQNTGANTRVGVVIRETLDSNARSAFMGVNGTGGFNWASRANPGAGSTVATSGSATAPNIWLRLLRKTDGNIEGYKSTDGVKWTRVKTIKLTAPQVYIGIAVSSGTSGVPNTDVFSNVTVVP